MSIEYRGQPGGDSGIKLRPQADHGADEAAEGLYTNYGLRGYRAGGFRMVGFLRCRVRPNGKHRMMYDDTDMWRSMGRFEPRVGAVVRVYAVRLASRTLGGNDKTV